MNTRRILLIVLSVLLFQAPAFARVDLVILPKRDVVQLTIYNAADLTLVRENRNLTLKEGANRLEFSWANTLIDPTSLDMLPLGHAADIDVAHLAFPPRVRDLGVWQVQSRVHGKVPCEINYLTSGLSWRAFYMGTLSPDEKTMDLTGYVRVRNNSGEHYENAQVRVVVGKINLIDQIAELARRQYPYGRPGPVPLFDRAEELQAPMAMAEEREKVAGIKRVMMVRPKEIRKEGLSEYFLYTIEGTETIPNGWAKRLPSFTATGIPVTNLYKYDEERSGRQVVRFLSFKNDTAHKLGDTPIPGGVLKVFRDSGKNRHLSYEGQSQFKYIPVDEKVQLSLGPSKRVLVKATLMDYKTDHYLFDTKGNISGWDEIRDFEIETRNTRDIPIGLEIMRHVPTTSWEIQNTGTVAVYEKVDMDSMKYTLSVGPRETTTFRYVLTTHHGKRAD